MLDDKKPQVVPRLLLTITREDDQRKLEELFDSINVPVCFQFRGKGTAPTEMMDIFGIGGIASEGLPQVQALWVYFL